MFQLTRFADHRGLAVALRLFRGDAQSRHAARAQKATEFLANVHQRRQILDIAAREGVGDDGHGHRLAGGRGHGPSGFGQGFLDPDGDLADIGAHLKPSCPLIWATSSPPARECTLGPVVITSTTSISSARGLSFSPTSIESKWLRT